MLLKRFLQIGFLLALTSSASAALIVSQLAEFNGPFLDPSDASTVYPLSAVTIGTFTYSGPAGQAIVAATVFGTFGNLDSANTTALSTYSVNGVTVASCSSVNAPCFSNDISLPPVAWSYTFTTGQLGSLAGGSANFNVVQNGPFSVQTGVTELDVTYAPSTSTVPEPSTLLLFALGAPGLLALRRARRIS